MAQYDIVAVGRTPQSATTPILAELGPLSAGLKLIEEVDGPGECTLAINVETLQSDIKTRLRDLAAAPMEVWVYRDGAMVFAGPVVGGDIKGPTLNLTAKGLLFYLNYMLVVTDKTWTAVDQFTIAAEVVDDWQDLSYGDYGIVTTGVGTSGQVRTLAIPGATESLLVAEVLRDLGAADNGFDAAVDPATRTLDLYYPKVGSDLSASVFLDIGIMSPNIRFSVAPGIIASDVYLTGTATGESPLTSTKSNTAIRESFGRAGLGGAADNVSEQALLDDLAQASVDARGVAFFQPGGNLIPVSGAGYTDFAVGDTVAYSYDAGLGLQSGNYRVIKREVSVDDDGTESLTVGFE